MTGPFSENYWRDSLLFHGGIAAIGLIPLGFGLAYGLGALVAIGITFFVMAAVTAGINYLIDLAING